MADNTKATNPPQADPNPVRSPQSRSLPVDRSGVQAETGANLSTSDDPTTLEPDNDARRSATIEGRADRAAGDGGEPVEGADADRDALDAAENDVYGDDPLKQRGSGSRYQQAHPSARAHLAVVEQQTNFNEMIALARQLLAAAERASQQNRDVMKATDEARNAVPQRQEAPQPRTPPLTRTGPSPEPESRATG